MIAINRAKSLLIVIDMAEGYVSHDGDTGEEHLKMMLKSVIKEDVIGDQAFRWIGFVQGVLVCRGMVSVDQLKELRGL